MTWMGKGVAVAAAVWVVTCGGKTVVDPGSEGSGGTGAGGGATSSTSSTSTTSTTSSSSNGSSSSGWPTTCDGLEAAYETALEDAKACHPELSKLQCVQLVDDELPCPCPTYVNPDNDEVVDDLDALAEDWSFLDCGEDVVCPAMPCPEVQGAGCDPTSSECVDFGPD